jgi:hypothetical protein
VGWMLLRNAEVGFLSGNFENRSGIECERIRYVHLGLGGTEGTGDSCVGHRHDSGSDTHTHTHIHTQACTHTVRESWERGREREGREPSHESTRVPIDS